MIEGQKDLKAALREALVISNEVNKNGENYSFKFKDYEIKILKGSRTEWVTPESEPYSDVLMTSRQVSVPTYSIQAIKEGNPIFRSEDSRYSERMYKLAKKRQRELQRRQTSDLLIKLRKSEK